MPNWWLFLYLRWPLRSLQISILIYLHLPKEPPPAPSGFRDLVQQEVTAVTIDDPDNDPLLDTQLGITTYLLLPISQLFDAWSAILTKHTQHSTEEEFALYELLDLDAEGEDDVHMGFDETTEQVLIG